MKIPGVTFSLKRAMGITKVKQKISMSTGIPLTRQGLERKIGGAIINKLTGGKRMLSLLLLFCLLVSCKSASEKYADAELARLQPLLNEVYSVVGQCKTDVSAGSIIRLNELCSSPEIDVRHSDLELKEEDNDRLLRQQHLIDSLKLLSSELCREYVRDCFKVLVNEDVLVESVKTYPLYLKKGTRLVIDYIPSGAMTARLYNADSRSLLKTYSNAVSDTLDVRNNAIYLFELTAGTPQYASVQLLQKVNTMDEFTRSYSISSDSLETTAGAFRARKVSGIDMIPIFEEPHKFTLRSQLKNFWDVSGQCRSIAALKVPKGATDILYKLYISTNDDGSGSDGRFFDNVYAHYKQIKFLGLPLYEKTGTHNGLLRELLNGCYVEREEKAYCNLYVFNSSAQAKKFQDNVDLSKLSYNLDFSASGTQSRTERISAKGVQTIYLGFENPRQTHDVYLWLEALAVVPKNFYYTEKYSLK